MMIASLDEICSLGSRYLFKNLSNAFSMFLASSVMASQPRWNPAAGSHDPSEKLEGNQFGSRLECNNPWSEGCGRQTPVQWPLRGHH